MTRACETAERPRSARVRTGRKSFACVIASGGMFVTLRLSRNRSHFTIRETLNLNAVERARRRAVEYIACLHVERAFVTRTFESPALMLEINGAGKMCTLLTISIILRLRD